MLVLVAPEKAVDVWPHVKGFIADGLGDDSGYAAEDVFGMVYSGRAQLWIWLSDGVDAAAVTFVDRLPRKTAFCVLAIGGGSREKWWEAQEMWRSWARQQGCTHITALFRRRGWLRLLRDWKLIGTVAEDRL